MEDWDSFAEKKEVEIFFIYDREAVQCEFDSPEIAVLYLYPPTLKVEDQCALCGQLVGMVAFTEVISGSIPAVFKMKKGKFCIKSVGRYIFCLGGKLEDSDAFLIRTLEKIMSLLQFYHCSLDHIRKAVQYTSEDFPKKLAAMFECYLPFCLHYGESLQSLLDPLPYINFDKMSSYLCIKGMQILEMCQRREYVLAGCLLCSGSVVCSQVSPELTSNLLLLRPNQDHLPSEKIDTGVPLPYGVRTVPVYVTEEEYDRLTEIAEHSPYGIDKTDPGNQRYLRRKSRRLTKIFKPSKIRVKSKSDLTPVVSFEADKILFVSDENHVSQNGDNSIVVPDEANCVQTVRSQQDKFYCENESNDPAIFETQAVKRSTADKDVKKVTTSKDILPLITDHISNAVLETNSDAFPGDQCELNTSAAFDVRKVICGDSSDVSSEFDEISEYQFLQSGVLGDDGCTVLSSQSDLWSKNSLGKMGNASVNGFSKLTETASYAEGIVYSRKAAAEPQSINGTCKSLEDIYLDETKCFADNLLEPDPKIEPGSVVTDMNDGQSNDVCEEQFINITDNSMLSDSVLNISLKNLEAEAQSGVTDISNDQADCAGVKQFRSTSEGSQLSDSIVNISLTKESQCNPELRNRILSHCDDGIMDLGIITVPSNTTKIVVEDRTLVTGDNCDLIEKQGRALPSAVNGKRRTSQDLHTIKIDTTEEKNEPILPPHGDTGYTCSSQGLQCMNNTKKSDVEGYLNTANGLLESSRCLSNVVDTKDKESERQSESAYTSTEKLCYTRVPYQNPNEIERSRATSNSGYPPVEDSEDVSKDADDTVLDGRCLLHLYVQAHSDTVLALFMRPRKTYELKKLKAIWESVLPYIGELEAQITSNLLVNQKKVKSFPEFAYAKYSGYSRRLECNLKEIINPKDTAFVTSVQQLHEQFTNSPSIKDCLLRNYTTAIYGRKCGFEETYFQQRGQYVPGQGPPTPNDFSCILDQFAQRRLRKEKVTSLLL